MGYNGKLTVIITIEDGIIKNAFLRESVDDEPYLTDAVDGILPAVVQSNQTNVDAVSGATTTSHALLKAVDKAIAKAEKSYQRSHNF